VWACEVSFGHLVRHPDASMNSVGLTPLMALGCAADASAAPLTLSRSVRSASFDLRGQGAPVLRHVQPCGLDARNVRPFGFALAFCGFVPALVSHGFVVPTVRRPVHPSRTRPPKTCCRAPRQTPRICTPPRKCYACSK